jgi:pimeloyl-ACP methyl ester carboxylesterase
MSALQNPPRRRAEAPSTAPLPWEWFEFTREGGDIVAEGARCDSGQVLIDGHAVPYKFMQRTTGHARPVLVILHGMGLTIASFRGMSGYLFQSHDLLLPDYSSLALATASLPADASFKTMVAAIWRIVDKLHIERFSLAGNSLGGGLCLMATLDAPERVERIALSNPACFPQLLPHMYRLVRYPLVGEAFMFITPADRFVGGIEYIGYADKSRFDPALRRQYLASLSHRRTRLRLMQIIRSLPHDHGDLTRAPHLAHLDRITQPVLISWGLKDPLLVKGAGHRLAEALPNCTLEVHVDLAHMPHEEMPERLGPRWAQFFNA